MGLILAFLAAWWLRGVLAVIALILAWNFLVPAGSLGKPAAAGQGEVVQQPQATTGAPAAAEQPRVTVAPRPTATSAPVQPVVVAPIPDASGVCRAFHDYGLKFKPEVATSGTAIQVEYWSPALPPGERETFMMAREAGGGRFLITRPDLDGHVWEYQGPCTEAYLMTQVRDSTARRLAGGADNRGYVPWRDTGLFQPAVPPS